MTVHNEKVTLVGKGKFLTVTKQPKAQKLRGNGQYYDAYSACSFAGDLVVSDHHTVKAVRDRQLVDLGAPEDPKFKGSSHNQCLYPMGDTLFYLRRDNVFVLRKGKWTVLPPPN